MVFMPMIIAFGFGIGLNPPIDIHIPPTEEIALEIEEQRKANTPEWAGGCE
jgi:hypothetical protein